MISQARSMRIFSVALLNELCLAAAREAIGYDAPEAEVNLRAQAIFAFLCDWLPCPSLSKH